MPHICPSCKSNLSSVSALNRHMETNKKCLAIRNEKPRTIYKCEFCEYEGTIKVNYSTHLLTCKKKTEFLKLKVELEDKQRIIDEQKRLITVMEYTRDKDIENACLKTKLEEQQKRIKDLESRATTSNSNNTNNYNLIINFGKNVLSEYSDITDNIQTIVDTNITLEKFIREGVDHVIDVIINNVLGYNNNKYYVSSQPKDVFFRKIGHIVSTDDKAHKLIDDIYPIIYKKCQYVSNQYLKNRVYTMSYEEEEIEIRKKNAVAKFREFEELKDKASSTRKKLLKKIIENFNVSRQTLKDSIEPEEMISIVE